MASGMNDIKARIKSVESTMQITKAMELVAASKLRRAKETAERTRPFYETLCLSIDGIALSSHETESEWLNKRDIKRTLYIVFAGDRGLAAGYNSNVFKLTESTSSAEDAIWMPIGKKSLEYARHKKHEIYTDAFEFAADQSVGSMITLGKIIAKGYLDGEFDRVCMVYTKFVSMITQTPTVKEILPLKIGEKSGAPEMETDCDPAEMLDKIVPTYIGGILYSALTESLASESGARRAAMNSANKNAEEIIGTLMLTYNRARQASITQEITEIVSGAEAL